MRERCFEIPVSVRWRCSGSDGCGKQYDEPVLVSDHRFWIFLALIAGSVVFDCPCRQQIGYGGGAPHTALMGAEKTRDNGTPDGLEEENAHDGFAGRHDTNDFSAKLQAEEVARYGGELKRSKELETVARDELRAAQLELSESQLKIAELNGSLMTAADEKTRSAATEEQLRLEIARLKNNVDRLCSAAKEGSSQEVTDTLVDEVKELRLQLTAITNDRYDKNALSRVQELANCPKELLWQRKKS